jgi:hypothetical protein
MKIKIQISLLTLLIGVSGIGYSQNDSTNTELGDISSNYPDKCLYRWSGSKFAKKEKSIGIVPSIQGVNELYLGLGISKAQFIIGEGGGTGFGATLGVDYNPIDKIIAPKMNLWATGFAFFFGGNIGLSGFYYIKEQESNFVLKPEIGIGYLKIFINYGYNIFLRDDFEGVSKHTFTLSYYHTFLPFKKKKKAPNTM